MGHTCFIFKFVYCCFFHYFFFRDSLSVKVRFKVKDVICNFSPCSISVTQAYDACFRCNPCSMYIHPRSSMWKEEKLSIPTEPCKSLLFAVLSPFPLPAGSEQFGPSWLLPLQHCCWHWLPLKGGREGTVLCAELGVWVPDSSLGRSDVLMEEVFQGILLSLI